MKITKHKLRWHPGVILKREMNDRWLGVGDLSRQSGIAPQTIYDILCGKQPISPAIAGLLARALPPTTADWWLDLQRNQECETMTYCRRCGERYNGEDMHECGATS
jgi:plasmid maintenance system antidote protein VapI